MSRQLRFFCIFKTTNCFAYSTLRDLPRVFQDSRCLLAVGKLIFCRRMIGILKPIVAASYTAYDLTDVRRIGRLRIHAVSEDISTGQVILAVLHTVHNPEPARCAQPIRCTKGKRR